MQMMQQENAFALQQQHVPVFHEYAESGPFLLGSKSNKVGARFRMAPSNTTIANTIRRQILSAVPTVGFRTEPVDKSDVVIDTNTTPIVNEMLAHRIGMIPIRADPATFKPENIEFRIAKENDGKTPMDVSASDFVVMERNPTDPLDEGRVLPTEEFFPPDPITGETCLITRLRPQWNPIAPNEKLSLRARAMIGKGSENSRWSPVSQCSFENTRDDDPERVEAMFQNWIAISKKPDNDASRREFQTMEIQRCFRVDARGEPNDFTFFLESVGVLSVPAIVRSAIEETIALLSTYQDLDGELPDTVKVQHGDTRYSSVDFIFQNESHTLGNLLQYYLVDRHVEGQEEPAIAYAGYKVPHPLKKEMVLRVGLVAGAEGTEDPETELQTARFVVAKVVRHVKEVFRGILADWAAAASTTVATAAETNANSKEVVSGSK